MVKVIFEKGVLAPFIKEAKKMFPVECMGMLIGRGRGKNFQIFGIVPPLEEEFSADPEGNWIEYGESFIRRAESIAKEVGLEVLGDIHTHCYTWDESPFSDPLPSMADFQRFLAKGLKKYKIFGICELRKSKKGRIYKNFSWWDAKPPHIHVERKK